MPLTGIFASSGAVRGAYESLASFVGNGTASTYTFSNISQEYRQLEIRMVGITNGGQTRLRINGVSTGYTNHTFYASGGGTRQVVGRTASDYIMIGFEALNTTTTRPFNSIISIVDSNTNNRNNKTIRVRSSLAQDAAAEFILSSGFIASTAPTTSITIYNNAGVNYAAGTVISLYGIKVGV